MKTYTLGFLFKENKIILAKKKRKFGVGKWNGYGGGIEEGEDKPTCFTREIEEECGLILEKDKCKELGYVDFHFKNKDESNQRVFIFRIDEFSGYPKETAEMGKPEEFDLDKIPFHEMTIGDDKFVPFVVEDKKFGGEIYFSENGDELLKCTVSEIKNENSNELKIK